MKTPVYIAGVAFMVTLAAVTIKLHGHVAAIRESNKTGTETIAALTKELEDIKAKLTALESEDQYVTNQKLKADIAATNKAYEQAKKTYEKLVDARAQVKNPAFDKDFALALNYLSDLNYASAAAKLIKIDGDITTALAQSQAIKGIDLASVTLDSSPPGSGYRRQKVSVGGQEYVVDIAAGDLSNTKVIVDTASNETCANNCPVLPLADYAARNGAWAAINGSYFCPESYPSCAGKTNSFDLLLMNKNKVYFNSDNNVYSTNPAVIFTG